MRDVVVRDLYLPIADVAAIYDNSDSRPLLIAEKPEGASFAVVDNGRWASIQGVISR
jgi:predicted ABC-type ATPase